MATKKSSSKSITIVVVFIILWLVFIGVLYISFLNRSVIEYDVRDGVVIGEKGFLEARVNHCICGTGIWAVLLVLVLILVGKKRKSEQVFSDQAIKEVNPTEPEIPGDTDK